MRAWEPPSNRRLFGLAASLVLASGAALFGVLAYLHGQSIRAAERLTASFAQVIEEQTSRTLQTVDQQLQLAASRLAERSTSGPLSEASSRALLQEQISGLPFVRAMWVLDTQGRIVHDSDIGNIGISLADRAYFKVHRTAQTGFYIGDPVRSRTTGTWLISTSRPLTDSAGRFAGVLVAALEPPYFDRLWRSVDLGDGGSVALLRRSGKMMMRSPFDEAAMNKGFEMQPLFSQHLPRSAEGQYKETSAVDGQTRLYAYRTMGAQPGLVVMVGHSYTLALGRGAIWPGWRRRCGHWARPCC